MHPHHRLPRRPCSVHDDQRATAGWVDWYNPRRLRRSPHYFGPHRDRFGPAQAEVGGADGKEEPPPLPPPSCPALLFWRNPARVSPHCPQVFGIDALRTHPGRMWLIGLGASSSAHAQATGRSIVVGDIARTCSIIPGSVPVALPVQRLPRIACPASPESLTC